jgi:hypothetical protein
MKIISPRFARLCVLAAFWLALWSLPASGQTPEANPPAVAPAPAIASPATATEAAAESQKATALFERMATILAAKRSISARIRLSVDMFGKQLSGNGAYLQQGLAAERLSRLELRIALPERNAAIEQVCDGRFFWHFSDLADKPAVTRLDLKRVVQALNKAGRNDRDAVLVATSGGLPKLVENLRESFSFNRVEAAQLDSLPVWVIAGAWQPPALAPLSPELAQQAASGQALDIRKLPVQMPEQVLLYLGQDDLFPYRMEFRRRPPPEKGKNNSSAEMSPVLVVELFEVRLNDAVDPRQFVYQPAGVDILDMTEHVLKSRGLN